MFENKRVLAIIPARGGSKGIPLKNLTKIMGKSLIGWAADLVKSCPSIDAAVVSTDHEAIREDALKHSLAVPFMRPAELSGDRVGDLPVLSHALLKSEEYFNCTFDIVLMLQPTSPLRKPEHIEGCMRLLISKNVEAVWTLSQTDTKAHPLKQLLLQDEKISYYDPQGATIIARQMLAPAYHRNGLCYAFTRSCILEQKTLLPDSNAGYLVEESCVSIDTPEDVAYTEFLLQRISKS